MTLQLSLVVVHYDIPREISRTLRSLSTPFQTGVQADDYEILVVDNGSTVPPDPATFRSLESHIDVISVPDPNPSPARAVNVGLNAAMGRYIGVFVDGARMASPRLLASALEALRTSERSVVGTRGRYLGPGMQRQTMLDGYDRSKEDALLEAIDWERNGYGLFDISVFDESSGPSWFHPVAESNGLFMPRELWRELGGYCEEFTSPGGGFVNLDAWKRVCELPCVTPVLLAGEATFHQIHGGVATNRPKAATEPMRDEYRRIRGSDYSAPRLGIRTWGDFRSRPPLEELGIMNRERRAMARRYAYLGPKELPPVAADLSLRRRRLLVALRRARFLVLSPARRVRRSLTLRRRRRNRR
jgi:glycosyltransferase involved in cell wall biosynthesis